MNESPAFCQWVDLPIEQSSQPTAVAVAYPCNIRGLSGYLYGLTTYKSLGGMTVSPKTKFKDCGHLYNGAVYRRPGCYVI